MDRSELDRISEKITFILAIFVSLITVVISLILIGKSIPLLQFSISELLFGSVWQPFDGKFGFFPFIMGTIWVTLLSMVIAIPLAVFSAIYLAEYSPRKIRDIVKPFIDLLAGIPSILFGLWGVLVIVPLVRNVIAPAFGAQTTG